MSLTRDFLRVHQVWSPGCGFAVSTRGAAQRLSSQRHGCFEIACGRVFLKDPGMPEERGRQRLGFLDKGDAL